MKQPVRLLIFYIDYYIGSVFYCALIAKQVLANIALFAIALMLDLVSTLFTGRYALALDGRPVRRNTLCGKEFFVKEPSIISEITCHLRGKTILRDESGIPLTDEVGKFVKSRNIKVASMHVNNEESGAS